jgi:hypothetical protein
MKPAVMAGGRGRPAITAITSSRTPGVRKLLPDWCRVVRREVSADGPAVDPVPGVQSVPDAEEGRLVPVDQVGGQPARRPDRGVRLAGHDAGLDLGPDQAPVDAEAAGRPPTASCSATATACSRRRQGR